MIPQDAIAAWGVTRPWPSDEAIEQDLLLARAIVEIYRHPFLRDELAFRGGTCLHQLHLARPLRYSEDLDFVRLTHSPIGPVYRALREVGETMGISDVHTVPGRHPKVRWRVPATSDPQARLRIKIEMNTFETSPARPHVRIPFAVASPAYFVGDTDVLTFHPAELLATKLRALHQRKKGRDLFDLWLGLTEMGLDPDEILEAFGPYRPEAGYTRGTALATFERHLRDPAFRGDLDLLVTAWPDGYDIDTAGALVVDRLLSRV
ncbi:MAG: nucleotidyl transferase AbiEii/AbiGii toxin family protein [Sporichthyaceae bacterium]